MDDRVLASRGRWARQAEVVCVKVSGSSIVARQKSSNPFAILKDAPI
jgi:hypothetical protein